MALYDKNKSLLDPKVAHFQREVLLSFGERVSVVRKAKGLTKFGKKLDLGTSLQTVWDNTGDEVYCTTNVIDTISGANAGDTQPITIEGHTVEGTGEDAKYTFVIQTATLDGQNKVTLSTPLARVSRAYNNGSTDLAGDVYVYEDTAIVAGVPTDTTKIHIIVDVTSNQSFKAATTFSNGDFFALTNFSVGVNKKTAASVDFRLEVRLPGKVFRTVFETSASSGDGVPVIEFDPPLIVPKNSDVRVQAISSSGNTEVTASFTGYIAEIY